MNCTCKQNQMACSLHGVAASNHRQSEYWKSVGGHPPPEYQDHPYITCEECGEDYFEDDEHGCDEPPEAA